MINVTDEEADQLSIHLNQPRAYFDTKYLEKGSSMMVINAIPCHFLNDNKCTIYDYRFAGCREFPALHLPHFSKRLFTTFMHYNRCPIIYNVIEQLKTNTGFYLNDNNTYDTD
jgi:Fe-S-cluster containining protein